MKAKEGKFVKQMSITQDKRQTRVSIPEFLVEIFDINPKEDKFNWYVERGKQGRVRLMAVFSRGGNMKNIHIGKETEEYFEKDIRKLKWRK